MHLSISSRFCLRPQYPRQLINEILKLRQFLLHVVRSGAAGRPHIDSQLGEPMLMHLFLLVVVAHTLIVAVLFHLLHYLIHVVLYILSHPPYLLQGFSYLRSLYLPDLGVLLRLLLEKVQVLVPHVLQVLEHRSVKISYRFLLDIVTQRCLLYVLLFL